VAEKMLDSGQTATHGAILQNAQSTWHWVFPNSDFLRCLGIWVFRHLMARKVGVIYAKKVLSKCHSTLMVAEIAGVLLGV